MKNELIEFEQFERNCKMVIKQTWKFFGKPRQRVVTVFGNCTVWDEYKDGHLTRLESISEMSCYFLWKAKQLQAEIERAKKS